MAAAVREALWLRQLLKDLAMVVDTDMLYMSVPSRHKWMSRGKQGWRSQAICSHRQADLRAPANCGWLLAEHFPQDDGHVRTCHDGTL